MDKKRYQDYIDERAEVFCDASDKIWGYAELSLKEHKSCALYCEILKKEGFKVTTPVAGIDTAFMASYGSGRPVIGILAEYDALSGLSQKAATPYREELVKGGTGHGCGHNMLGAGSMAAAFAVKKYLEDKPEGSGTIIFYGCPGEEGGASKAFMARDGVWKDLDCALTWHPSHLNYVDSGTCNSCIQTEYAFKGLASHASAAPEYGRSALDALELMSVGVNFLREHMPDEARIHYAITDGGGASPNVVQPHAQVLYMVRSVYVKDALKLQERVDKIAQGAALMTETELKKKFIDGCSNLVPNRTLQELLYKNLCEVGSPKFDEEDMELARKLVESYEVKHEGLPREAEHMSEEHKEFILKATEEGKKPLNDFVVPYEYNSIREPGSTDVGDVSWLTPTAQVYMCCFAANSPGHSWQNVACGNSPIGHKGLLAAGKVLCGTAIDLFEDHKLIEEARAEFEKAAKGGYVCPVPEGAKPVLSGEMIEFD
ncbi:MAG TPA: amidohydrolase [Candidatus Avilachnospira avistercoris]|nr:amidohydrolase [Candidatus Avilachnospira avistercoris]